LIFNVDDYHNLHQTRIPNTTSVSQISHMATLLINNIATSPIPFVSSENLSVHNSNGVEAALLKNSLDKYFKNIVHKSYNQCKAEWNFITDMTTLNNDDLIESLIVHSYDADSSEMHSKRSFKSTKLIDFSPLDLKNTNDYLKALKIFFK
jgi:hypothetical protein